MFIVKIEKETEGEGDNVEIEFQGKIKVDYSEIKVKSGFIISLKKVLDPLTDERELALVTQSHVQLARKMFLRDPGSAPCSGERVPSVYVERDDLKDPLQWQKAEHPAYAKEHNMKLDVLYYLEHQLRTPITQIFSLMMKDPNVLFDSLVTDYKNKQNKQHNIDKWFAPQTVDNVDEEEEGEEVGTGKSKKRKCKEKSTVKKKKETKKQKVEVTNFKQTGLSGWLQNK